jgi:prefoldin subunit 5
MTVSCSSALCDVYSELHGMQKSWEGKFTKSRAQLEQKIPDVKRALGAVRSLEKQAQRATEGGGEPLESHFELSDGLYVRASIPPSSTVCLWLGANVMVEYPFDEAIELLTKNLNAAMNNLKSTEADIAYLRDQINTTDVNLSQVYNVRLPER